MDLVEMRQAIRAAQEVAPDLPVIGIISRLVWQKGFDIVGEARIFATRNFAGIGGEP